MKTHLLLGFFTCFCSSLFGQFDFSNPASDTCYDQVTEINYFQNWTAYQTIDDTYDGLIDSTVCIDITASPWMATLMAQQFDVSKPVFLKWKTEEGYLLEANSLYTLSIWMDDIGALVNDPLGCEDDLCNGYIIKVRVPDNPNDLDSDPEYRWHKQEFMYNEMGGLSICLPTENFENGNYIDEIILKVQLQEGLDQFGIYEPFLEYVWLQQELLEESIASFNQDQFNYYLSEFNNYLVRYQEPSFPALDAIDYLEIAPSPNITEQAVVNVTLGEYASLVYQPFTDIRGALVEGQEELRHYVNLINDGTICMNFFLELVMPPGGIYTHRKGHLESSWGSCMRFQPTATLLVDDHSHLHFGQMGMGMLATQSGALIDLQHAAALEINCPWRMFSEPWQTEVDSVYVYLYEGNSLVFGPYASLENFSTNNQMKLVIHMRGGFLDLGPLTESELEHVVFDYPIEKTNLEWLRVESLVTDGRMRGACRVAANESFQWSIHSISGQQLFTQKQTVEQEYAQFEWNTNGLNPGLYTLSLMQGDERIVQKFVVQ